MSLFGGEGSAPPTPSAYESESEQSQQAQPTVERYTSPPSAQNQHVEYHADNSGEGEDFLTDSESESISDHEPQTRPNRFKGRRSVWRAYTAADRQLVASLEQIQNSDLGAHLYNAHALKRRVRKPVRELAELKSWQSRETWSKRGRELEYTDVSGEIQTDLVPSKDWTAWPLPPAKLPTPYKQPARTRGDDNEWATGNTCAYDGSEEVREELLALFLRLAKERWSTREVGDKLVLERGRVAQSQSRSRSKSIQSARSQRSVSKADIEMKDGGDHDDDEIQTDNAETQDEDEEQFGHATGKRRGRVPQPETFFKPSFLADDARALRTLQPVVNSVLSKLDDLALAVRRTRLNHFGRGIDGDYSTQSEFTSGTESNGTPSRPSSKAQSRSRPGSRQSIRPSHVTSGKDRRATSEAGSLDKDSVLGSDTDFDGEERDSVTGRDETFRIGLMDWSEVLGLAAVKGWNEKVIARTAQRCAILFGESMSFRPLDESLATKPVTEPIQYIPSTIPAPNIQPEAQSISLKRPLFRTGTLRCPHTGCYGNEKEFEMPYRVVQHCIRVHGYDPRTNDSDNEDRAIGGVHIDGFLQPIDAQKGWLARGKSRANSEKRKQKAEREESIGQADAVVVDSD